MKTRLKKIKSSLRKKITGTPEKPRLSVFRSNKDIYCQLIDDVNGQTITSSSSREKSIASSKGNKSEKSLAVGESIAKKAIDLGIKKIAFDRNGYLYHGRVKFLAEGARKGGLTF